jgi:dihydroxy-acid dehydratase
MMLPGSATIPANDTRRLASAEASGRRAVELVRENLLPAQIMTRPAFENALRVFMTIGGSTNAQPHIAAMVEQSAVLLSPSPSGSRTTIENGT